MCAYVGCSSVISLAGLSRLVCVQIAGRTAERRADSVCACWRGVGLASGVAQLIMQVDKLSNNIILFALYFPRTKYMYHRHHCLRGPLALRLSASTWENPLSARGLGSNLPALRCI